MVCVHVWLRARACMRARSLTHAFLRALLRSFIIDYHLPHTDGPQADRRVRTLELIQRLMSSCEAGSACVR